MGISFRNMDCENSYNHNFYEDRNVALSKADENLKRDSKFSIQEKLHVPSTNDEINPEDKNIYDEKTITEVTCPDKVVISENIIKDVCIDEGAKVSPNTIEENRKISSNVTEEGEKKIALKTVQDQSPVPDENEVIIGEIPDEKIISLKELFFSEDQKSSELDTKKFDEKKLSVQSIKQHTDEATVTIGSDAHEPIMSSNTDFPAEEIIEEQPASVPVLSGTVTCGTEETSCPLTSVPTCRFSAESHTEVENSHYYDGPKITPRRSFSQNYGELNIQRTEPAGNNSARIAYSGSISMRSDSSTTSARSFAFPILQSEWNNSPVKMAKANRRRYRKHCGWRSGLFCCGF